MVDWSYELLSEAERAVLRRLAVFSGGFELDDARAVVPGASPIEANIASLVEKSLLTRDVSRTPVIYRFLETMRAYALEKLEESGERDQVARMHASHVVGLLANTQTESTTVVDQGFCERVLDDARLALDWAFSESGDVSLGIALTMGCFPLWFRYSLRDECRGRSEQALAKATADSVLDPKTELGLTAVLAGSSLFSRGSVLQTQSIWLRLLELATSLDDTDYMLHAIWGLCVCNFVQGSFADALTLAHRFAALASKQADPSDLIFSDRLIGIALYNSGQLDGARQRLETMLRRYVPPLRHSHLIRFDLDQRNATQASLAKVLWLQGFPDRAMALAQLSRQNLDHPESICFVLVTALCPIAILNGDFAAAASFITELRDQALRNAVGWQSRAHHYMGWLALRQGDSAQAVAIIRQSVVEMLNTGFTVGLSGYLRSQALALQFAGQYQEGLAAIDAGLAYAEQHQERWCVAELYRGRGELALLQNTSSARSAAEGHFVQAIHVAQEQGALAWELRAAISLARMQQDDRGYARSVLAPVFERFTEGFATADLDAARVLLDSIG